MDEPIELTIDGIPCALDAVPPELKAHVERSVAAARAAAEKAGAGKATLRINIKRGHASASPAGNAPLIPGVPCPARDDTSPGSASGP